MQVKLSSPRSEAVIDVDRPDVNGQAPKMLPIAEALREALAEADGAEAVIYCDDNLMSTVRTTVFFQPRSEWSGGIAENAPGIEFRISPAKGKRYYDPQVCGGKVKVEMASGPWSRHGAGGPKFVASTTLPERAVARIVEWLGKRAASQRTAAV